MNGYAYVYLSNESNEPVYFDDFKVNDTREKELLRTTTTILSD